MFESILCYIFLMSVATLCLSLVATCFHSIYNEYKKDKREEEAHRLNLKYQEEKEQRDLEYHKKRMAELG